MSNNDFTSEMTAQAIEQIETRLREARLVSADAKGSTTQGMNERLFEKKRGIDR